MKKIYNVHAHSLCLFLTINLWGVICIQAGDTSIELQKLITTIQSTGGIPVKVHFDATGVDYDAFGRGVAQGVATALTQIGDAVPRGMEDWSENARKAGGHAADAQEVFFEEVALGAQRSAPHLRAMQQSYVRSLLHPTDIASYAATVGMGMFISLSIYYAGKLLWMVVEKLIIKKISKPKVLIRKKMGLWDRIKSWFTRSQSEPMILDEVVRERLLKLVRVTKKTNIRLRKKNNAPISYRNILLWGPPGTGKTMFARYLAEQSGMDFAETTGGAFFQEGAGIQAVDDLFDWAERSRRGLVIFIDEADSLFVDRTLLHPGSQEHRVVNHFLNRLGQASNRFMLVAATNHKVVLDKAMTRRIQELIYMPLPSLQTRVDLISSKFKDLMQMDFEVDLIHDYIKVIFSEAYVRQLAQQMEGFSHADIAALFETLKTEFQDCQDDIDENELEVLVWDIVEQYCAKRMELGSGINSLKAEFKS